MKTYTTYEVIGLSGLDVDYKQPGCKLNQLRQGQKSILKTDVDFIKVGFHYSYKFSAIKKIKKYIKLITELENLSEQ